MTTQEVKRKLAAILSADVKGYSRLMGEDEKGTVRTLNAYKEVMTGLIQNYHGRVVDAPGDNLLAEFSSVVNAVECAVEIQKELKTRNAELPENRRMEFRIGVNLGDVIEDGEQILGTESILLLGWRVFPIQEVSVSLGRLLIKLGTSWSLDMNILASKPLRISHCQSVYIKS
jgi:hypothetical protein